MFPTEAVAMAWATLAELLTHLNVNQRLVNALEAQFGPFNDRIDAIASIPEHIWRTEVGRSRYLAHAAVIADPNALPPVAAVGCGCPYTALGTNA